MSISQNCKFSCALESLNELYDVERYITPFVKLRPKNQWERSENHNLVFNLKLPNLCFVASCQKLSNPEEHTQDKFLSCLLTSIRTKIAMFEVDSLEKAYEIAIYVGIGFSFWRWVLSTSSKALPPPRVNQKLMESWRVSANLLHLPGKENIAITIKGMVIPLTNVELFRLRKSQRLFSLGNTLKILLSCSSNNLKMLRSQLTI